MACMFGVPTRLLDSAQSCIGHLLIDVLMYSLRLQPCPCCCECLAGRRACSTRSTGFCGCLAQLHCVLHFQHLASHLYRHHHPYQLYRWCLTPSRHPSGFSTHSPCHPTQPPNSRGSRVRPLASLCPQGTRVASRYHLGRRASIIVGTSFSGSPWSPVDDTSAYLLESLAYLCADPDSRVHTCAETCTCGLPGLFLIRCICSTTSNPTHLQSSAPNVNAVFRC